MALVSVSDFIAQHLSKSGLKTAFVMSGGAALNLIHSLNNSDFRCVALNHEFSVAAAADSFSRVSGRLGLAVATSGPGATNLVTGIAGAYYDSVPVIFLTGQVSRSRSLSTENLRQYGFQQTPFVEVVAQICKGAFSIKDPREIKRVLMEAEWLATEGRPGPVVIDIPDDVQREMVDGASLVEFNPPMAVDQTEPGWRERLFSLIQDSQRPVFVVGAGVRQEDAGILRQLVESFGFPVVSTWGASGLLTNLNPLGKGFFGTHGSRSANLIVQNSDLIISVGCRLDTKATGSPATSFARDAKKVVVDIDAAELAKFSELGVPVALSLNMDSREFILQLLKAIPVSKTLVDWLSYCDFLRTEIGDEDFSDFAHKGPNPIALLRALDHRLPEDALILSDTGLALPFVMEYLASKSGRKVFHDFNNTAMGWSVGASIGASLGRGNSRVITITGDGSLALGLSDLSSLGGIVNDAKVILLDNAGHGMIRQTQDQWFGGTYVASSAAGGLFFPDWGLQARAAGFEFFELTDELYEDRLERFLAHRGPALLRVELDESWHFRPQVRFGYPNEDQDPPISRSQLLRLMKVPLQPQSLGRS